MIIVLIAWQFIPFHTLLYQMGRRQIPEVLHEAARLDGAGPAQMFWRVTLPQLTMTAAAVPVSVLVMVGFVRDIPRELIGAVLVDGGTEWTVFRRLIVPLSKPVLATLAIYNGLNVWNDFILPLVLTQSNSVAVLPLGLTKLEGQYAINVPAVMAAVLLSVLPLVVLFVVMRKQVMRSLGSVILR